MGGEMYRSVLVATDGSETAAEAVRAAISLARTFGAMLHIASVYRPEVSARAWSDTKVAFHDKLDPAGVATTQTESMAVQARAEGVPTQTHVVTGFVAERIVSIAKENGVELIVVGNKGMRGLKRVLGSVPNAVAHSAPCAVLIVNTT
jgi:nucleotide-binding universal stress UspA family protein